ncbi:EF-hand domain-containing protein [Pycnococcus provasolii]
MSTPAGNQALGEVRKVLHGVRIADCPPELREKLAQYDTNGNGTIDPDELPDPMSAEMTYLKVSSFPKKVQPLLNEIDDEKNGKIEMDELTDILTVYSDLKKANKEGSIAIKTLPKEIQPTLKVFDVDGDGTVAPMELARGAELYKESKKTAKRLTIFSGVLLVILCALVGVIVALTAVVVEASKETKTDSKTGITFAKGSSKPSATAKVTKTGSIYNAVKKSASALRAVGSLTLVKPDGSSLIYTITGAETYGGSPGNATAVAFYSARGDVINVTATSLKVTKEDGTIVMTDTAVAEKSRRRRLLGSGSDSKASITSDSDSKDKDDDDDDDDDDEDKEEEKEEDKDEDKDDDDDDDGEEEEEEDEDDCYEVMPYTGGQKRKCTEDCEDGYYEETDSYTGKPTCKFITLKCPDTQHEIAAPTKTTDRQCTYNGNCKDAKLDAFGTMTKAWCMSTWQAPNCEGVQNGCANCDDDAKGSWCMPMPLAGEPNGGARCYCEVGVE